MRLSDPISVAILAGGKASRFGADKTLELIHGKTMIHWVYESIRNLSDDVFVVTKPHFLGKYDFLKTRMVFEPEESCGAIYGFINALKQAKYSWVLILAADMPAFRSAICIKLAELRRESIRAIIPQTNRLQPLAGLYSVDCLSELEHRAIKGDLKLETLSKLAGSEVVSLEADFHDAFANINTRSDYEAFLSR